MITPVTLIRENYERVLERIGRAARLAGRSPESIRLVVVTKGHSLPVIQTVIEAGARVLGENYVEEAVPKMDGLRSTSLGLPVEWHMIGHVQSRKAQAVSQHFADLHSLDSLKLAARLDRFAGDADRRLPVMLECNVSGEGTKFGLPAYQVELWEELLTEVEGILALPNLHLHGLMTMAPYLPDPEQARPFFQKLRQLLDFLRRSFPSADWKDLSMGMSGDFEVAVQEGATLVRIGTAILGERPARQG